MSFRLPGIETEQLTIIAAISKTVSDGQTDSGNGRGWKCPRFSRDHHGRRYGGGTASSDIADGFGRMRQPVGGHLDRRAARGAVRKGRERHDRPDQDQGHDRRDSPAQREAIDHRESGSISVGQVDTRRPRRHTP